MTLTRRALIAAGGLLAASPALASPAKGDLAARARAELSRVGRAIPHRDVVGIADYSNPSSAQRFHLVDMATGGVSSFLVSHGRGSDPGHSGWVRSFSNDFGSNASSQGAYRTGDYYVGKHGRSMRLAGLDGGNSNAEARAIVVHGAWYVSPKMLHDHGKLGRSEGCFAFSEADLPTVLARLGPGRLLLSAKL